MGYAGGHRYLTYLSLLLSAVSAVLALFPFVFPFRIIREVIAVAPDYAQATHIVHNGWMAAGFALLSIVVYVCALMSSHLSALTGRGLCPDGQAANRRPELGDEIKRLTQFVQATINKGQKCGSLFRLPHFAML